jgi:hypothetical protein
VGECVFDSPDPGTPIKDGEHGCMAAEAGEDDATAPATPVARPPMTTTDAAIPAVLLLLCRPLAVLRISFMDPP